MNGLTMMPGKKYLCSNAFTGQMLLSRWTVLVNDEPWSVRALIKARPWSFDPFDPSKDWNNCDVWLNRGGGYGDLMMLTPLIRELKKRWPFIRIHVACGKHYWPIFDGIDVFLEKIPIPFEKVMGISAFLNFEELIEGNPKGRKLHMADLFADQAGIKLSDHSLEYHLDENEKKWALAKYPRNNGLPRIGIQVLASAFCRTYPQMQMVMADLAKKAEVYLFGSPGQLVLEKEFPNIHNLTADNLTFRESAAVLATCNCCVSPDSAMVHIASALDVPCVALYGPFPSGLRITSMKAVVIEGKAPCAPCFFHADLMDEFPQGMPCTKEKMCVAMKAIPPEEVVKQALELCS